MLASPDTSVFLADARLTETESQFSEKLLDLIKEGKIDAYLLESVEEETLRVIHISLSSKVSRTLKYILNKLSGKTSIEEVRQAVNEAYSNSEYSEEIKSLLLNVSEEELLPDRKIIFLRKLLQRIRERENRMLIRLEEFKKLNKYLKVKPLESSPTFLKSIEILCKINDSLEEYDKKHIAAINHYILKMGAFTFVSTEEFKNKDKIIEAKKQKFGEREELYIQKPSEFLKSQNLI